MTRDGGEQRVLPRVQARVRRLGEWLKGQDPNSLLGVAVGSWRRFRTVDGPSQTALLSAYFLVAVIPAVLVIGMFGEGKTTELLVASQVALSMQLGFAVWPLVRLTGERATMGGFANRLWLKILGWTTAAIIILLNVKLLLDTFLPVSLVKLLYGFFHLPIPTH